MSQTKIKKSAKKMAYSIEDLAKLTSISRSIIYLEIKEGKLLVRKCRRRSIVMHNDAIRWLKGLPPTQTSQPVVDGPAIQPSQEFVGVMEVGHA